MSTLNDVNGNTQKQKEKDRESRRKKWRS